MWVPDDRQWTAIRHVLTVDGKRLADGELERVLKEPLPERESRLHRLAESSAQFNIGSTTGTEATAWAEEEREAWESGGE